MSSSAISGWPETIWESRRMQSLGLVGLGNIARNLIPEAKAFGLRIVACDRYVPIDTMIELGLEKVEFDQILEESDFISIHAAFIAGAHHMFGLEQLKNEVYCLSNKYCAGCVC